MPVCTKSGCPAIVTKGRCAVHAREQDLVRGTAQERGYDYRWSEFSKWWLSRFGLCGMRADGVIHGEHRRPACQGRAVPAECTDHIVPLSKGGAQYDEQNLQSLCIPCNTAKGNR